MKICEYCRTKVADQILECNNCGAKQFKHICIHCDSEFSGTKCPVCIQVQNHVPVTNLYHEPITNLNDDPVTNHNHDPITTLTPKKTSNFLVYLSVLLVGFGIFGWIALFNNGTDNSRQEAENLNLYTELLTREAHPRFYGDHSEAKKFWKGYDQVKVVNARLKTSYEDALLLVTTGDTDHNIITNITINLSNVVNKQEIRLDDVLKLICDYIPYEIINKYYTFEHSFHEIYKTNRYEAYHYVMQINDNGKAANLSGEKYLAKKFAFKIIHRNDDDWIAVMNYLAYEGNHSKTGAAGGYDVRDWDVDIYQYSTEKSSSL